MQRYFFFSIETKILKWKLRSMYIGHDASWRWEGKACCRVRMQYTLLVKFLLKNFFMVRRRVSESWEEHLKTELLWAGHPGSQGEGEINFLYISVSDLLQQRVDNLPSPPKKSQGCWVKENGNWVPLSSEDLMRVATDHKAPLVQGAGSRGGSWRTGVRVAARGATCLLAYGHLWWGGAIGGCGGQRPVLLLPWGRQGQLWVGVASSCHFPLSFPAVPFVKGREGSL